MLKYFAPIEAFRPQFLVAMRTGNVDYAFNPLEGEDQAGMARSFKRIGADYLLFIRLKQRASVFIGSFAREILSAKVCSFSSVIANCSRRERETSRRLCQ